MGSRTLFSVFGSMLDIPSHAELRIYYDPLAGMIDDAEIAFKKAYREVIDFQIRDSFNTIDQRNEYFQDMAYLILKAAAFKAGTKDAGIPLLLFDMYFRVLPTEDRQFLFSLLLREPVEDIPWASAVDAQNAVYFVAYSGAQDLLPDSLKEGVKSFSDKTTSFYKEDVACVDWYKRKFSLVQNELMLPFIVDPQKYCNTKYANKLEEDEYNYNHEPTLEESLLRIKQRYRH